MLHYLESKQLTKNNVLAATNGGQGIFKHYIPDFYQEKKPFRAVFREDKHPSANVFRNSSGTYLYKDFAEDKPLNPIEFIMRLHTCDFSNALQRINRDLKLGLGNGNSTIEYGSNYDYWKQFEGEAIPKSINQTLAIYRVKSVKSFTTNQGKKVVASASNPIFAFELAEGYNKIYRPLEPIKKYKHQFVGKRPEDFQNIYGIAQLPTSCNTLLIVEGLKDCIVANSNLNHHGIYAVGIDNVSTHLKPETLQLMRSKCKYLVLCLDIDEIGLKMSAMKARHYGLRNFILPSILSDNGGKDISDWFKLKLSEQLLLDALGEIILSPEPLPEQQLVADELLTRLLATEQQVGQLSTQPIVYSPPLISLGDLPIIRRGTINIIQGKYGSHKSRLAELFCSHLLAQKTDCLHYYLHFEKTDEAITVVYIDTERNLKEELPAAIQSIKEKGCFGIHENPTDFRFTSIKQVERKKRLGAVKSFIEQVRDQTKYPLFVLLDVVTDCVSNFNDPKESMQLFDYLGNLCDNYDATFLLVIHQNPGGEKARGHTGTEAANKASTVMQIGFEQEGSELLALKFLKLRAAQRPPAIHLVYDSEIKGLALAHEEMLLQLTSDRPQVAEIKQVAKELGKLLCPNLPQKELLQKLKQRFDCSDNTLKSRLEEISAKGLEITNQDGVVCQLDIKAAIGKATVYELLPNTLLLEEHRSNPELDLLY